VVFAFELLAELVFGHSCRKEAFVCRPAYRSEQFAGSRLRFEQIADELLHGFARGMSLAAQLFAGGVWDMDRESYHGYLQKVIKYCIIRPGMARKEKERGTFLEAPEGNARSVPLPVSGGDAAGPVVDHGVWYAGGLRFECTQCGNCCSGSPGYVWLTVEDMERMAAHLHLAFDDFTRRYVRQVGQRFSLLEKPDYDCVFLTREGGRAGCSIYEVRPMQCRTWPFWNDNLRSPRAWKNAGAHCPGMQDAEAPLYDLAHIEKCRQHPESPH